MTKNHSRMIYLFVYLLSNPVFASAMNSSIVGLHDVLLKDFKIGNYVLGEKGCGNSQADMVIKNNSDTLRQNVSLLTQNECHIRKATTKEDQLYSGVVALGGPRGGDTGQFIFNEDAGVSASNSRVVLTALHGLRDKDGKRITIDPETGKIDPTLFKVHVEGCSTDQNVLAVCTSSGALSEVKNDYAFLVVDKSKCNKKPTPIPLQPVDIGIVKQCPKIHVACSLTPGLECGTAQDRSTLSDYSAVDRNITGRRLFFGDGTMDEAYENFNFFYKVDTAKACSGGAVVCDYGNSATLLGIHKGSGSNSVNSGIQIHQGMIDTLKACTQQMRAHISAKN